MIPGLFITGTDTDVGKTWVTLGLLNALAATGVRTAAMKPVACGAVATEAGLHNDDALRLQRAATVALPYALVNPYCFAPPIAPHIAAQRAGICIDTASIKTAFDAIAAQADCVVVEGAGGWCVPLNARETLADLALRLELPVVLVVGMRLGCLNHSLLSAEAIVRSGLPFAGWVANSINADFAELAENIAALSERIPAPLLGVVPHLAALDARRIGQTLNLATLLR